MKLSDDDYGCERRQYLYWRRPFFSRTRRRQKCRRRHPPTPQIATNIWTWRVINGSVNCACLFLLACFSLGKSTHDWNWIGALFTSLGLATFPLLINWGFLSLVEFFSVFHCQLLIYATGDWWFVLRSELDRGKIGKSFFYFVYIS